MVWARHSSFGNFDPPGASKNGARMTPSSLPKIRTKRSIVKVLLELFLALFPGVWLQIVKKKGFTGCGLVVRITTSDHGPNFFQYSCDIIHLKDTSE